MTVRVRGNRKPEVEELATTPAYYCPSEELRHLLTVLRRLADYCFLGGTLSSFNSVTRASPEDAGFTALSMARIFPSGPI